ncbi:sulfurtransferase complex subunit TusD [Pasteurellaceae bacterium TAE3-ERU1]|uniref:sulfurtransferase complex subunit TusD n=1 Tax=Spirabiliibacterium mucosae TaxID=28156 RepID=UPI001AAE036D|nr:sulfurtransferase complex subunit TusD [Spirabiliibacterium mucosae]MBE2898795.1 sulfurtransferase complex subunit TusD [Spirabiliibacterium mucosae]MBV7388843.1 sulfurtransferase complex subunit TusD [Pasteurellaceae bacterium TAE3-ERU1]
MRYVLQVTQSPNVGTGNALALAFATELLKCGHEIAQVFFYGEGVLTGNALNYPANDEPNLTAQWQAFAEKHQVRLNLCIAAAQRRGVVNSDSSASGQASNLAPHFELAGLADFIQATLQADRVVTL